MPTLVMNEDGDFVCPHEATHVEVDSFDFAGTHCTNGQPGTQVTHNAICDDCNEDISDTYDWDGYFADLAEGPDYD